MQNHQESQVLWKTKNRRSRAVAPSSVTALSGPRSRLSASDGQQGSPGPAVAHTGHPRARYEAADGLFNARANRQNGRVNLALSASRSASGTDALCQIISALISSGDHPDRW